MNRILKLILVFALVASKFALTGEIGMKKQIDELKTTLRGKKIGYITNPTGVDENLNQIADILVADNASQIVAFFAPEHGLRGDQQAGGRVTDYIDSVTSLPVHSLYGANNAPSDEQLKNIDALLFDIQDVGVRFYTYIWTMTH